MQRVFAAACRKNASARVALLLGVASANAVAAFEMEARSELRPWGVLSLWLCSIAAFLAAATLIRDSNTPRRTRHPLTWIDVAALALLTIAALLVRTVELGQIPWNFAGDEGDMGLFARAIIDGRWNDPFTTGWASHPTLWFYFQALSLRIFGDDVVGLRLLTALIGAATVPALYLFARMLYGWRVALIASALLIVYHVHVHYSRIGLSNASTAFFELLSFGLVLAGWRSRSPLLLAAAGVSMGVAQNFYYGTRLELIVLVSVLIHRALLARNEVMALARYLPLTLIGFVFGWGPGIRVLLYHRSDYEARLAVIGIFQSGWFRARENMGDSPLHILVEQLGNAAGAITSVADRSPFYLSGMPLLDPVSSFLFVIGLIAVLYRWRSIESALLVAWLVVALVGGGFLLVNAPESHHFVTLAPLLCLVVSLGIDLFVRAVERAPRPVRPLAPAMAVLTVGTLMAWNLFFYFGTYSSRHVYGFRPTESATAIGRYIADHPGHYVFFVGPPYTYLGNGSIQFIARTPPGLDVPEPIGATGLPPPPHGLKPVVIVDPARIGELASVRHRYPGTTARRFRSDVDGALLFASYNPSPTNWPG